MVLFIHLKHSDFSGLILFLFYSVHTHDPCFLDAQKQVLDNRVEKAHGSDAISLLYSCFFLWKETTVNTNKEYKGLSVQPFGEDRKSCIGIASCWQRK